MLLGYEMFFYYLQPQPVDPENIILKYSEKQTKQTKKNNW